MEKIDHMQYLPEMEVLEDSDIGARVVQAMQAYDPNRYTASDVKRALAAEYLTPEPIHPASSCRSQSGSYPAHH